MNETLDDFKHLGIERCGILLFDALSARVIVEEMRKKSVPLLGIDAFILAPNSIQPVMDKSLDLSRNPGQSWSISLELLNDENGNSLFYEIVLP